MDVVSLHQFGWKNVKPSVEYTSRPLLYLIPCTFFLFFNNLVLKESKARNDALQARELKILEDENRVRSFLEALQSEKTTLARQHAGLQERQNDIEKLEKALEITTQELEAKWKSLAVREETLSQREITIQLREKSCEEREAKLLLEEARLKEQLERVELLPMATAKDDIPSILNDSDVELLEKLTISVDEGEEIIQERLSDVSRSSSNWCKGGCV